MAVTVRFELTEPVKVRTLSKGVVLATHPRHQGLKNGGGRGIRTPGRREPSTVFKTVALNHSTSPPARQII